MNHQLRFNHLIYRAIIDHDQSFEKNNDFHVEQYFISNLKNAWFEFHRKQYKKITFSHYWTNRYKKVNSFPDFALLKQEFYSQL